MATNRVGFNRLQQAAGHGGGAYTSSKQNHMLAAIGYHVYSLSLDLASSLQVKEQTSLVAKSYEFYL